MNATPTRPDLDAKKSAGGSSRRWGAARFPRRSRMTRAFIAVFVVFYLCMVLLHLLLPALARHHDEIFPFFAWTLLNSPPPPNEERTVNAVLLHTMDGAPTDAVRYLIPSGKIADAKALQRTIDVCERDPAACDATVEALLFPIVRRLTNGGSVEFSIVRARVDLRGARREIRRLADGEARKTDFFRPEREVGRWTVVQ